MLCVLFYSTMQAQITDPTDIPDLVHWVDAQNVNGGGAQPADGATVNSWSDLSSSGLNLGPGTQAEPVFDEDGWNGTSCPAIRFGLGNAPSNLAGGDPFGGTQSEATIFLLHREAVRRNALTVQFNGSTFGQNPYILTWSNARLFHRIQNTWVSNLHGAAVGDPILMSSYHSQTGNPRRYLRANGVQIATSNAINNNSTAGGLHLGWGWNANTYYFNGWIAEMIIYNRALTPAEVQDVEDYLNDRWSDCAQDVDLAVTKEAFADAACTIALPMPVNEGDPVYYCITIENNGPGTATNVELIDTLPDGVTFQSTSDPGNTTYTP